MATHTLAGSLGGQGYDVSALLETLMSDFRTDFYKTFNEAEPVYPDFAITMPSSGYQNVYAWIEQLPAMREWNGPRHINRFVVKDYTLVNRGWEDSWAVNRYELDDDRLGVARQAVQLGAIAASYHPDALCAEALNAALTGTDAAGKAMVCWDGYAMCSSTSGQHTWNGLDWINKTNLAFNPTNYESVYNSFITLLTYRGTVGQTFTPFFNLGKIKLRLIVGPDLKWRAQELLFNEFNPLGATNTYRDSAKLTVVPGLTAKSWFLTIDGYPLKPIVYQLRQPVQWTQMTEPGNPIVWSNNEYTYGGDMRDAAGFTLFQLLYGSTGQ